MARVGESIDARLLRLDPQVFRSIESAGASTGAMYANLGSTLGKTITSFTTRMRDDKINASLNEALAASISINPGDGTKTFDRKNFMDLTKGKVPPKAAREFADKRQETFKRDKQSYVDTTLKQEQLAATQDIAQIGAKRLLKVEEGNVAALAVQQGMLGIAQKEQTDTAKKLKKREEQELEAGVLFEGFTKDLLIYQETLDPEKRGTLLNKLTADYSFSKFGAAGQRFSDEYNTTLKNLYSLANPTLRTKPEEFADLARKIEEFSLIGDGPVSLTTDGRIDMNKVKKWYDTFPEPLRLALATPLAPGSKKLIVTTFPDEAVHTIVQNFVNTYTSFQGTARTLGGVAPSAVSFERAYGVWRDLNQEERRILGAGKDVYRDSRSRIRYERLQPQLIQKIGADVFAFLQNEIAVGNL